MTMNKLLKISLVAIIPIVIFGVFLGSSDFLKEDITPLETDTIPIYIPSDITKANPNFIKMKGQSDLWATIHVEDVVEDVEYTIQGTVLSIDEPVDWNVSDQWPGSFQIMGFIPITISVENVYKGNLTDETFTFYIPTNKINSQYHIFQDSANFEVNEKVLIHLSHTNTSPFSEGHYSSILAQFSKYQLQTIDSLSENIAAASNIDNVIAFNVLHPDGISLESVSGEALP